MEFLPTQDLTNELSAWLGLSLCDGSEDDEECDKAIEQAIEVDK